MNNSDVTVRDIDIPFGRLVLIILKIMLASIPALIVFYAIMFALIALFAVVFGGGLGLLNQFGQ